MEIRRQLVELSSTKWIHARQRMTHTLNPSTREAETVESLSLQPAKVYRASSRTARATPRNPVSKNKKRKKRKKKREREKERIIKLGLLGLMMSACNHQSALGFCVAITIVCQCKGRVKGTKWFTYMFSSNFSSCVCVYTCLSVEVRRQTWIWTLVLTFYLALRQGLLFTAEHSRLAWQYSWVSGYNEISDVYAVVSGFFMGVLGIWT